MIKNLPQNYIPFARKYRPKNFAQMRGQEVLTKILSYSISKGRLAHAHLLTGIRGVGKTSSARIIAKTINCSSPSNYKITTEELIVPCEACDNCKSFVQENHPDIIEIDAASHTSVDDIRQIIQSSEYRPLLGKYKVFIIDEIHMLSKNAFNALLKIVEEPPAHIIFLFATTEVRKIPITIISRCQRYDLRRLTHDELTKLLQDIAKQEQLNIEPEVFTIIVSKADGSARDAVSLLDQAASNLYNISGEASTNNKITATLVRSMLGIVSTKVSLQIIGWIIANNPTSAIRQLSDIYNQGGDLEGFMVDLAHSIAELTKIKMLSSYKTILYQDYEAVVNNLLFGTSLSRLTILWQIFSNGTSEMKTAPNQLICAEMLVIKAIYSCNLPTAEAIMRVDTAPQTTSSSAMASGSAGLDLEQRSAASARASDDNERKSDDNARLAKSSKEEGGTIPPTTSPDTTTPDIFELLRYCHSNKELEIYYLLLNETEIVSFEIGILKVRGNLTTANILKLTSLLQQWSQWGAKWQVKVLKTDIAGENFHSLKSQIFEEVKSSEDYQLIKNRFPNADISDIILDPTGPK